MSNRNQICVMPGCPNIHSARGYCKSHYDYKLRSGELGIIQPHRKERAECSFPGCDRKSSAKGLCQSHRKQQRKGLPLTPLKKRRNRKDMGDPCKFEGCIRLNEAQGWCRAHYQQFKSGRPMNPIKGDFYDPNDPLTWSRTQNEGYVYLYATIDGKKFHIGEHRAIMERFLGRKLLPQETVHHINGVRNDNRIENLELWSHTHPYGQRGEDKVDWAVEILKLYRPEVLSREAYFKDSE